MDYKKLSSTLKIKDDNNNISLADVESKHIDWVKKSVKYANENDISLRNPSSIRHNNQWYVYCDVKSPADIQALYVGEDGKIHVVK